MNFEQYQRAWQQHRDTRRDARASHELTECTACGDRSNSAPGLACGRKDTPEAEPCQGTYQRPGNAHPDEWQRP